MKKTIWKLLCCFLLMTSLVMACTTTAFGMGNTTKKESDAQGIAAIAMNIPAESVPAASSSITSAVPLVGTRTCEALSPEALEGLKLSPGGMPFGVKFFTEGVTVVGFCDVENGKTKCNPAAEAGLRVKDVILKVNGVPLSGASDLTEQIEGCGGKALSLVCKRNNRAFEVTLKPVYSEAEARYKTGIWVRDSGAGIGTVTFIFPETGAFAGLGHGICDAETGELIAMRRGSVSDVTISSVVRGASGAPGELKGYFNAGKTGALLGNSGCGVWGVFSEVPECAVDPMEIGLRGEVEEGEAAILCTLDSNKINEYGIRISNIDRDAQGQKCFTVTVTDPNLLAITGGIVQGMSGSPIIQNGKLVGAVTHVMINDPTTGYGIFIENMLAQMGDLAG